MMVEVGYNVLGTVLLNLLTKEMRICRILEGQLRLVLARWLCCGSFSRYSTRKQDDYPKLRPHVFIPSSVIMRSNVAVQAQWASADAFCPLRTRRPPSPASAC